MHSFGIRLHPAGASSARRTTRRRVTNVPLLNVTTYYCAYTSSVVADIHNSGTVGETFRLFGSVPKPHTRRGAVGQGVEGSRAREMEIRKEDQPRNRPAYQGDS